MNSAKMSVRWAEMLVSAAVVMMAALLVWNCLDIYRIGTSAENIGAEGVRLADVYTREDVAARLARMGWCGWVLLGAVAGAVVERHIKPCAAVKLQTSPDMLLIALLSRRDRTSAMRAEEGKRRLYVLLCGGVCAVCALIAGLYLFSPAAFASTDLEAVMGALMIHTLPWLLLAFGALMVLAQLRHSSLLREIESAKDAPRRATQTASAPAKEQPWLRAALYAAAIGLIVAGILNGGMYDVLVKAVNICTECIGLG